MLCLFQSSQKNSATRPYFFFSMHIFTYIIPLDAGRCIVTFFTFETLTYHLFRDHLECFNCGFRASIPIRFRDIGGSILEKVPLFNFGRSSQNSFCVRLRFSALILSHSLRKPNFWVAVQRFRSAWQTTFFWCRGFFGFGFTFLAIFCKSSSYSRNHWWNIRSLTPSEDSFAAECTLIFNIGKPSSFNFRIYQTRATRNSGDRLSKREEIMLSGAT